MLKANWILPSYNMGKVCPLFRKDFSIDKQVNSATLYITARGVYEATINSKRVGDFIMAPGFAKIHFAPSPDDRIEWFKAEIDTGYGKVSSRWWHEEGKVHYEIITPVDSTAVIEGKEYNISAGKHIF